MTAAISRPFHIAGHATPPAEPLATVRFGLGLPANDDARSIQVPLALLHGPAEDCWLSATPVASGWQAGAGYSENGAVLIGQVQISPAEIARIGMAEAALTAYSRIQRLLSTRGYPHALRLWNFIPHILQGDGDDECYRQFNIGRATALEQWPEAARQLPAATAIGTPEGSLLIYVIAAATVRGVHAENPRQLPATRYPRQYGIKSPNFSRATRVDWADGSDLLVSGTASVVGHETRHPGNVLAQFGETLDNLAHLVAHAAVDHGGRRYQPQGFKLYLKSAQDLPLLLPLLKEAKAQAAFGDAPVTCVEGTICRHDLLVEVEGIYQAMG